MDRKEKAIELHSKVYNCAQAVLMAFEDKTGADSGMLMKLSEGFGGGMGTTYGTCGALSGAIMLAGLKNADGNTESPKTKGSTYKLDKELYKQFTELCGASICRELKGIDTGKVLCSCDDCIRNGVEAAEKVLFGE